MEFKKYNDYELLYLISWHSEAALEILLKKYEIFIKVKLNKYKIPYELREDYLQELKMVLMSAIYKYNENYTNSFYNFLDMMIERRIIRMIKNEIKTENHIHLLEEEIKDRYEGNNLEKMINEEQLYLISQVKLSPIRKQILDKVLLEGMPIKEFANMYNLTVKDVYNHIYHIRLQFKRSINL